MTDKTVRISLREIIKFESLVKKKTKIDLVVNCHCYLVMLQVVQEPEGIATTKAYGPYKYIIWVKQ